MEYQVFKIAILHLEGDTKDAASEKNIITKIKKLVDMVKGESEDTTEDLPAIENSEDFYEAAKNLNISKTECHRAIMNIFRSSDSVKLPAGLIGDIGEYLGEKDGIGVIPTTILERTFNMEDLYRKMKPKQWDFFFKDNDKLKKFKKLKGY